MSSSMFGREKEGGEAAVFAAAIENMAEKNGYLGKKDPQWRFKGLIPNSKPNTCILTCLDKIKNILYSVYDNRS